MPQSYNQQTVNQLVRGLITEAGELNFPDNASIDELNCVLGRDASRTRRRGLEPIPAADSGFAWSPVNYTYFHWKNAGGVAGLNFLVIQTNNTLRFIDLGVAPITDGVKSFTVNLNSYGTVSGVSQFSQIFSGLIVTCPGVNTLVIRYNSSTDFITVEPISFVVRDFAWQSTYASLDDFVASPNEKRRYDTYNAGWYGTKGSAALASYVSAKAGYPPLTHPWYSGKNSSGDFSVAEWEKIHAPTSITANGAVKVNFFSKDRNVISGLDLPLEVELNRFSTVSTFAGRVWYSGLGVGQNSGKILYSQTVTDTSLSAAADTLGQCFQVNDPTSEDFSDLLETDGGEILIPEAVNIKKIHAYGEALFVFAENGVWFIKGVDSKFSPTSYFVSKVTNVGIESFRSFISVEGVPFWWSKNGIHTIVFDESSGFPTENNLTIGSIQTFFNNIPEFAKKECFGDYDAFNQKIYWWFSREPDTYRRNHCLILDIPLKAFYPWSISGDISNYVVGSFYFEDSTELTVQEEITDSLDTVVTNTSLEEVYVNTFLQNQDLGSKIISVYISDGLMNFGQYSSLSFEDFGNTYDSFVEAGYFFSGDLTLKKNSPYVVVYCRSTEEGFTGDSMTGYSPINPSSLILRSYWDFKDTPSSSQQAYRLKPFALVNPSDLSDNQQPGSVVTTRLKIRGKGRNVRLRFESEEGKNFVFLGYSMVVAVNDRF